MNKIIMNDNKQEKNLHNFLEHKILELSKNKVLCVIFFVNIILIFVIIYILFFNETSSQTIEDNVAIVDMSSKNEPENIKMKVHITGEVKNSGIYELNEGSRISDIIEKAGGITTEADLSKVNLAYQIADGQKIIIPSIKLQDNGNYIIENSGDNVIQEEKSSKDSKININTASISELITLPGIGNSTAEKIINYREENGKFKNIEDIKNVSGIGESKYKELSGYIKAK